MEDQRSELPAPTVPDDDFFGLLQRLQASRYEDQRSTLAPLRPSSETSEPAGSSVVHNAVNVTTDTNRPASSNISDSRKSVMQRLNSLSGRKNKKGKH